MIKAAAVSLTRHHICTHTSHARTHARTLARIHVRSHARMYALRPFFRVAYPQGGWPAAVFYPLGHPTQYAWREVAVCRMYENQRVTLRLPPKFGSPTKTFQTILLCTGAQDMGYPRALSSVGRTRHVLPLYSRFRGDRLTTPLGTPHHTPVAKQTNF
jgi:hypothetical protein